MTPELVTEIIRLARVAPDMYALGLSGEDAGAWVYSFFRLRRQDMAMQRAMHYYRFGFSDGGHPRFRDSYMAFDRMRREHPEIFDRPAGGWSTSMFDAMRDLEGLC